MAAIGLNRTKQYGAICQAAGVGVRAIGTYSGPENAESTSHFEKNIIVLEKKKFKSCDGDVLLP